MAGRKSKKTEKVVNAVLANLRDGLSIEASATQAGICRQTLYIWMKDDPKFAEMIDEAKDFSEAVILAQMRAKAEARQDWRADAWLLERRFPERYGLKREQEITINKPDGSDVVVNMIEQARADMLQLESEQGDD